MKKIIILLPCWKKSKILQKVSDTLEMFCNNNKYDILVLYVLSKEDKEIKEIENIYNNANYKKEVIYYPNLSLGEKMNCGINKAVEIGFDYLMTGGSDTFFHPTLLNLYEQYIENNTMFFGINNIYFYEEGKDLLFAKNYNTPYSVGAGKMMHIDLIKKALVLKNNNIYSKEIKRGLDTVISKIFNRCGIKQVVIDSGVFPYIIDIKSNTNINKYSSVLRRSEISNNVLDLVRKEFNYND